MSRGANQRDRQPPVRTDPAAPSSLVKNIDGVAMIAQRLRTSPVEFLGRYTIYEKESARTTVLPVDAEGFTDVDEVHHYGYTIDDHCFLVVIPANGTAQVEIECSERSTFLHSYGIHEKQSARTFTIPKQLTEFDAADEVYQFQIMGQHKLLLVLPVYLDRFQRENGHNVLVAGEIGSGKTYDTKCHLLRRMAKDRKTGLVMIDPVGDFGSLAASLDAEHYVIGGTQTVNPLEIRPTPSHLLDAEQVSPFTERISAVMEFFGSFFAYIEAPLGDRRQVLERCVREAYTQQGITIDPATHANESPVIGDVRDILGDVAAEPTTVLSGDGYTPGELDKWQDHAEDLRLNLEPFTDGGQFAFLNGPTQVDLTGSRVVYLNLQQFGGGSDEALAGLVMQPMFDTVYERLKSSEGQTIVAIDEAHYLVEAPGSLGWLRRITRHSRHLNLSLQFITQELDDFYDVEGAETFINQSSIKLLHRQGNLKDRHTAADVLDLTDPQAEFVRRAIVGNDDLGFSHALLEVDEGGTYPIRVTALPEEEAIIEGTDTDEAARYRHRGFSHDTETGGDVGTATDGGQSK